MKVVIVAEFPPQYLPEFPVEICSSRHHHTWLPQIASGLQSYADLEISWVGLHDQLTERFHTRHQGQDFYYLPTTKKFRAATFFRRDREAILSLIDEVDPDLVHGWGCEDVHSLVALEAGRPHLISMQGLISHLVRHTGAKHLRELFCAVMEWGVLKRVVHLTCESSWAMKILAPKAPKAGIHLVEYGVDERFYDIEWAPLANKKVAVFVGLLASRKGIQDLIAIWSRPELKDVELRVCGSGGREWVDRLKKRAPAKVTWLGYLDRESTVKEMSQAWCLMLPTRADTSPNVVKEARVIGMPVITTPRGGQSDYIESGKNGFLVEPGDEAGLADATIQLFSSHEKCCEMGAWKHEEQRSFFRPERTARLFYEIYNQISGK